MKRTTGALLLVLVIYSLPAVHSQPPKDAVLVDSMGAVTCELLLSRLDYLAAEVSNQPGAVGFALLYPGKNPFVNAAYERGIKNNSAVRNFRPHLVQPVWVGEGAGDLKIEMWKITGKSSPPKLVSSLKYLIPSLAAPTRFVDDAVEVVKIDGKLEYITGGHNCVPEFDLSVLSKVLSENSELSAKIVIFNRSRRSARILSRLIRTAARENQIPAPKLKIIDGGSGVAREWSREISAVEIWLLPTKRK